jgi:hypothetical protein
LVLNTNGGNRMDKIPAFHGPSAMSQLTSCFLCLLCNGAAIFSHSAFSWSIIHHWINFDLDSIQVHSTIPKVSLADYLSFWYHDIAMNTRDVINHALSLVGVERKILFTLLLMLKS